MKWADKEFKEKIKRKVEETLGQNLQVLEAKIKYEI